MASSAWLTMIGELVGVETEVEGMQHTADERDAEVGLEVVVVVPAEGGDAVARGETEVEEDAGKAAGAIGEMSAQV